MSRSSSVVESFDGFNLNELGEDIPFSIRQMIEEELEYERRRKREEFEDEELARSLQEEYNNEKRQRDQEDLYQGYEGQEVDLVEDEVEIIPPVKTESATTATAAFLHELGHDYYDYNEYGEDPDKLVHDNDDDYNYGGEDEIVLLDESQTFSYPPLSSSTTTTTTTSSTSLQPLPPPPPRPLPTTTSRITTTTTSTTTNNHNNNNDPFFYVDEEEEAIREDELIAKYLQEEEDKQEEERKRKKKLEEISQTMHPENQNAIEYICQSVLRTNDADRNTVINKLHCTESDLDRLISYLIACPKIIHFHADRVLAHFVKDDQYRNQFETNTSSGTLSSASRISWETSLFGPSYSRDSKGIRPKYGVLMYNGYDMYGCPSARGGYGDSYLVLQNVEDRVTYCYGDSGGHGSHSNGSSVMGYGCWLARILNGMSLPELQFLYNLSNPTYVPPPPSTAVAPPMAPVYPVSGRGGRGRRGRGAAAAVAAGGFGTTAFAPPIPSQKLHCYIEIQVHGSVMFARDISMMCLPSRWKSVPKIAKLAQEFAEKNPNIFLNYIDE